MLLRVVLICYFLLAITTGTRHVAIVGSGISGASSATTLRQLFPEEDDLVITVFEKEALAGGRMADVDILGTKVEIGASVFHRVNEKMANFSRDMGLEAYKNEHLVGGNLGIWDGAAFRFWESTWGIVAKMQAALRYGRTPLRIKKVGTERKLSLVLFLSLSLSFSISLSLARSLSLSLPPSLPPSHSLPLLLPPCPTTSLVLP